MKNLVFIAFMFFYSCIVSSQNPEVNKTKPFSLEITATKDSNKPYSYLFNCKLINNKKHPKIIKLGCVASYKKTEYGIAFRILHNGKRFYDVILPNCGINKYFLFKKKHLGSYKINFEHIFVDGEFKRHSTNNNFGTYSIQAIWYLPKDTIYSNIIELEYRKEN
jgi:hypothetical protein